jgi:hypothetical protein
LIAKEEEARRNTADGGVRLWNEKTKSRTGILEMGKDGEEGERGERESAGIWKRKRERKRTDEKRKNPFIGCLFPSRCPENQPAGKRALLLAWSDKGYVQDWELEDAVAHLCWVAGGRP